MDIVANLVTEFDRPLVRVLPAAVALRHPRTFRGWRESRGVVVVYIYPAWTGETSKELLIPSFDRLNLTSIGDQRSVQRLPVPTIATYIDSKLISIYMYVYIYCD